MRVPVFLFGSLLLLISPFFTAPSFAADSIEADLFAVEQDRDEIIISRTKKILRYFEKSSERFVTVPIGIGRGGIREKKSMADEVTPTGNFEVDLILSSDSSQNRVSESVKDRYQGSAYAHFFKADNSGLSKLFLNMLQLDFNRDGKPDKAYGAAYIGLHSNKAVTGPKMRSYNGTPYWFSIALHGTPDEKTAIGKATSGGCVHLSQEILKDLLKNKVVDLGTKVRIID